MIGTTPLSREMNSGGSTRVRSLLTDIFCGAAPRFTALLTLLLIVLAGSASAQLPSTTNMNLYDSGTQPGRLSGGAMLSPAAFPGAERPEAGSVQMSLPLVHLAGRGIGVDVSLNYNGALYRQAVENNKLIIKESSLYPQRAPYPAYGFVMGYGMLIRHSDFYDCWNQQNGPCPSECPLDPRIELSTSNVFTFIDSTGATHRILGDISTDGSDLRLDRTNFTITSPDGTKIFFTSLSQQESAVLVGQGDSGTRTVCNNMASCTRVCKVYDRIFYATKVVDRNGNAINITYVPGAAPSISSIKDTLGREVRFVYDSTNNVTSIRVPGYQTDTEREVARLYYKTVTRVHSFANQPNTSQQVRVIDYVYLTGLKSGWHFDYSSYAQIYRVEKRSGMFADPVGGALTDTGVVVARTEYNYNGTPLNPVTNLNGQIPTFTTRKDDWAGNPFGELTHTFSYVYAANEHRAYVTVTAPDGTSIEVKRGLYNGWEHNTDWRNTWDEGLVYHEKVYKQNKTYAQAAFEWQFTDGGPRLKAHTVTNDAGQQKRTEYVYNEPQLVSGRWNGVFDNAREVKEFGFDGELLRRFEFTYEQRQAWKDRWLVKLCTSKKTFEGASLVPVWQADYVYDAAPLTTYASLPSPSTWVANTPAQRGNLTSAVTNTNAKDPTLGVDVVTTTTYDVFGNVVSVTTPNGNSTPDDPDDGVTTTAYSPDFQYAYATSVTSPAPDPSGNNGSSSPLTSFTDYNFNTGLVKSQTDANGATTVNTYTDPDDPPNTLNRLRKVESPGGGVTTYEYGDGPSEFYTRTRAAIDADSTTDNFQYFDALGRQTRAFTYDGSAAARTWIVSDTEYDLMGRVKKRSNPYFVSQLGGSASPGTVKWSESQYDPIGRVEVVTAADGSVVNTYYDGARVLSKDPAGNRRVCVTDALGRLTDVWEVRSEDTATERLDFPNDPDVTAGYHTHYVYDLIGNLIRIEQGAQTRFYAYDSLSRLIRARNPEQGVNSALALDPQLLRQPSDNNSWSTLYEYDPNGNLKKKIDARNIQTTNEYDGVNRAVHRSYSTPEIYAETPSVDYYYDGTGVPSVDPTNGGPLSAPQNAKGRLTATKSAVAETIFTEFDSAGRIKTQLQVIDPLSFTPKAYRTEYAYDLAGNLVSQKYPSGRVVVTESDGAGRVAGVKSQGQAGYYAGGVGADSIQYDAHGSISSMRLGNGLWEHTDFNAKLQPTLFGLGTTAAAPNVLKIQYTFGVVDETGALNTLENNGNLQSQTITAAGAAPFVQTYLYDELNRLASVEEKVGTSSKWKQVYHYDRFGNRTLDAGTTYPLLLNATSNPSVNPADNRINSAGYSYDAAGNLVCDPVHQCGGNPLSAPSLNINRSYFGYDAENRMVRAGAGGVGAGHGGVSYSYDGDGKRVKKMDDSTTTAYVYDAFGKLLAEYTDNPPAPSFGRLYVTTDALGTPRVATDKDRVARERHDYTPFGDAVPDSARSGIAGYDADLLRQKFTGKERDPETQLDFFQARYYSYAHGRFTSPDEFPGGAAELFTSTASSNPTFFADPLNPQSLNKYQYAYNNPLRYVDPTGHGVTDFFDLIGSYFMSQAHPEKAAQEERVETPFGVMTAEEYAYWWAKSVNENTLTLFEAMEFVGMDFGVTEWSKQVNASAQGKTDVLGLAAASLNMAASIAAVGEGMTASVGVGAGSAAVSGARTAFTSSEGSLLNCFVAGTPVHTSEGLRPIEEIKPGDEVLSWNQYTQQLEFKPVLRTFSNHTEELLAVSVEGDSSPIITTPGHPFYTRRATDGPLAEDGAQGWLLAKRLRAGSLIVRPGGQWASVVGVTPERRGATVYNFEVADNHDYYVGRPGVLVHNQSLKEGSFSIVDWTGYPAGYPKPSGPFRLLEGAEYKAARGAANSANNSIRNANPVLSEFQFEIHEVQPVKFGGSPTDPRNKIFIPRDVHRQQFSPWWNALQRALGK